MTCTRCGGSGFLNTDHLTDEHAELLDELGAEEFYSRFFEGDDKLFAELYYPDVTICDCCGNGEDEWYGTAGEHYNSEDPEGKNGPYSYNGGHCECH